MKTNPTNHKQAISYVRFSSKEQAKGDSYRRQTDSTANYCQRKGLILIDDFFDSGVSAFKGKNQDEGALSEIIERAKKGIYPKGTILIVESLDRISRQEINKALRLFLEILENGLDIVTLSDGERHYKHDKTELVDLIVSLVVLSRAHEESEMKSQRIKASWVGRRKEAKDKGTVITSICPAWMKVENGKFKLIPEKVKIVKDIFKMSVEDNMGSHAITTILNERGIKPWETLRENKSGLWSKTYVTKILNNIAVIGIHQPRQKIDGKLVNSGEIIKGYYPAIIDEDTFNRHKTKSDKRKKLNLGRPTSEKDWNLFKGLVKCSQCGKPMHFVSKASKGNAYRYLFCSGHCGAKTARYEQLELIVLRSLPTVNFNAIDKTNQEIVARNEAREGLIIEKKAELKSLKEKWKKNNSETILELIEETEKEIAVIKSEMEDVQTLDNNLNIHQRVKLIESKLAHADQSWRNSFRETVTSMIKNITLNTSTMETEVVFTHGDIVKGYMINGDIVIARNWP